VPCSSDLRDTSERCADGVCPAGSRISMSNERRLAESTASPVQHPASPRLWEGVHRSDHRANLPLSEPFDRADSSEELRRFSSSVPPPQTIRTPGASLVACTRR
jgi:hypothetical protein